MYVKFNLQWLAFPFYGWAIYNFGLFIWNMILLVLATIIVRLTPAEMFQIQVVLTIWFMPHVIISGGIGYWIWEGFKSNDRNIETD